MIPLLASDRETLTRERAISRLLLAELGIGARSFVGDPEGRRTQYGAGLAQLRCRTTAGFGAKFTNNDCVRSIKRHFSAHYCCHDDTR